MTIQALIEEILSKNPQLTREQLIEQLQTQRGKTGGLLSDKTLLRLIAAKVGVQVQQNHFQNSGFLATSRLFAGLNDVNVAGRLIGVFPIRTFQGLERSGKFATIMIADGEGILRVVLWDEKADLVEKGELKVGRNIRLFHGYTKEDRYGKTEMHLGKKSQIEIELHSKQVEFQIEKFAVKIRTLNKNSGFVHLSGQVKTVLGRSSFARNDNSEGTVMRFMLADGSGEVPVVAWNEKVSELEHVMAKTRLSLINARIKETQNGGIEVHVDSNTFIST